MDHELLSALGEFLELQRVNFEGRGPEEAATRARALQELSGLSTAELVGLAATRAKFAHVRNLPETEHDRRVMLRGVTLGSPLHRGDHHLAQPQRERWRRLVI